MPAKFWKAVSNPFSLSAEWVLDFFNAMWHAKEILLEWHISRVMAIFKKGDEADCANYRSISLINVGYKILAMILLSRMQKERSDSRICQSQFGFRKGRGISDALFLARKFIERTWARADERLAILASD